MKAKLAAGIGTAAAAISIAAAAPAHGATVTPNAYHHWVTNHAHSAGLSFYPYGDIFYLHDLAPDGHATYFQWRYPRGNWHPKHWDANGYNGPAKKFNFDFPEHRTIYVKVCTEVNNWPDDCRTAGPWSTS